MSLTAKTECDSTNMDTERTGNGRDPINPREYFDVFSSLLCSPIKFFTNTAEETGWKRAATFLSISALFNAAVSAAFFGGSPLMGAVVLVNNMFMPAAAAVLTFMVTALALSSLRFPAVFKVYAYASGLTLAVSWVPGLNMVTEPLRAILVCIGLTKSCGLKWWQSIIAVCATAFLLLSIFWSVAPLLRG